MVVLISGLNFASYLLVKILGPEHGIGVTGLLGGLVSSTAVTLGFAQRSREPGCQTHALALGTLVAWTDHVRAHRGDRGRAAPGARAGRCCRG